MTEAQLGPSVAAALLVQIAEFGLKCTFHKSCGIGKCADFGLKLAPELGIHERLGVRLSFVHADFKVFADGEPET